MKISVIIPFHKGLHFLADCLDSLSEQTEKDFEVLIISDRVEEDLDSLLASYTGKLQMQTFTSDQTAGVAAARNIGIENAQGEYLYFLDSDDYIAKDTLANLYQTITKQKSDYAYGPIEYTWFNRHVYHETEQSEEEQQDYTGKPKKDLLMQRLGLKYLTILNIMIRKEVSNQLKFKEDFLLYSDLPVLAKILNDKQTISFCKDGHYIKRFHNDEILYPSLSSGEFEDRNDQLINTYRFLESMNLTSEIKKGLDDQLLGNCQGNFLRRFRQEKAHSWKDSKYQAYHTYMSHIDTATLSERISKKVCKAFAQDEYQNAKKKINHLLAKKKIVKMLTNKRFFYRTINKYVFERFPQQDHWIVFESFLGKNYSDSPKYIYKYLLENKGDKYRYIWIINDTKTEIPGNPVKVKRFSLKYFYYMTRAKYWVNNMRQPVWYEKRDSQVLLETWHGTPLKRLVFDMDDVYSASPTYKRQVYSQSRFWDYLISANPFSTEVFQSCFLYEKDKIIESGYPRNDILYAPNRDEIAEDIKNKLGIPKDKKTILYAPTWRDDEFYDKGQYKFKLKLDLEYLRKEIGDEYVILLRTHYFIADAIDVTGMEDFVFNVCKYNDIAELYLISDICITDYSSVFFDYANLKRPILYFTYDLEKYRDVLRGFYISIEDDVPGPLLFTNEEIVDAIKHIDQVNDKYKERYEKFYDRFCCFDDGHASERVVKQVFGD